MNQKIFDKENDDYYYNEGNNPNNVEFCYSFVTLRSINGAYSADNDGIFACVGACVKSPDVRTSFHYRF